MNQIIWIVVIVLALVIEAATMGLTSIWFALAGLITFLLSFIIPNLIVQIVVFVILSGLMLYFLYPWLKKKVDAGKIKTNVDAVIGKVGLVTQDINNLEAIGQVKVAGQIWTARSVGDDLLISEGTEIEVVEIRGVKAIVKVFKEEE